MHDMPLVHRVEGGPAEDETVRLWRAPEPVRLSVDWTPPEYWSPLEYQRVSTRDFRKGYPMVWDLEVPMRALSRPLFLRPGVKRVGPPPEVLKEGTSLSPGTEQPSPAKNPASARASTPVRTGTSTPTPARTSASAPASASAHAPTPEAPVMPPSPEMSAPKGSRMKGWSRSRAWLHEDPWGSRP